MITTVDGKVLSVGVCVFGRYVYWNRYLKRLMVV